MPLLAYHKLLISIYRKCERKHPKFDQYPQMYAQQLELTLEAIHPLEQQDIKLPNKKILNRSLKSIINLAALSILQSK